MCLYIMYCCDDELLMLKSRYNFCSVLINFSFTVNAATLIFISGRGLAISSANAQVTHSRITSPVLLRI